MLKQSNMAFDCHGRKKPLLYSDLFKCHKNMDTTQEKEDGNIMISGLEGSSWISGSTQSSSTSGSSSSGFSTPLFSDLESDDADFMDELTRQMAECMFQEEEEEEEEIDNTESGPAKNNRAIKNGFNSCPACVDDQIPPIQVYELKNQPPVSKQGNNICRGKVGKGQQPHKTQHNYMHCRGRKMGRNGHPVSGMQAVFLGGSGSTSGSPGTGVFFPRVTSDPTQLNKKMSGTHIYTHIHTYV
ncbi:hypothetical protein OROMI_011503 [Orobanche minor]